MVNAQREIDAIVPVAFESFHGRLLRHLQEENFAGWDPFDGLNAKLFRGSGLARYPIARLAWIQAFKRSPVNFRRLAGVPKVRNPKGIALIVLARLEDYRRTRQSGPLEEANGLGDWLLEHRCEPRVWGDAAWGYPFDWQARAFSVPVGKPNIITTVYAALAMRALHEATGRPEYLAAFQDAGAFVAERMFARGDEGPYFRYIPGEDALVHNASLWGAALAAMAGQALHRADYLERARLAIGTSLAAQQQDGSWPYGKRGHHAFVDSFHTGFNLEALHRYRLCTGDGSVDEAIETGLSYYREHFFLQDGTPKYYNHKIYPIDVHCSAQAIITLLRVGTAEGDRALASNVLRWTCAHMQDDKTGAFYYQKHRFMTNRISYMRWSQAWMLYALAIALREGLE